ncbi:MAG: putative toxin-antitoxin system toxin component, PIN family [Steroidobacteraceae bacterium]
MRAIIDTNVLLSGLFWLGPPHSLLDRVRDGSVALISSSSLLAELSDVLVRPKFDLILERSSTSRERSLAEIWALAEVVSPPDLRTPICRRCDHLRRQGSA